MSDTKVDPGPGYRLLEDGEIVPSDAEYAGDEGWTDLHVASATIGRPWTQADFLPMRVKLPEPLDPKSLSLEEILAQQEAKPCAPLKHDGHYRTLEAKGAEPIECMEALVCRGIPEDLHRIAKRNLNMAMASQHQDRAGEKSGESWEKELQKAENYLHRAWSGRWI